MTGVDPAAPVRGKYTTEKGAYRQHRGDLGTVAGRFFESAGCREVPPMKARRGDLVAFETDEGETLGIVDLANRIVAMGPAGPAHFRYGLQHRAWQVD